MLSGNALIGDRFIRYTVMLAALTYRDFGNSGAANIIVRIRVIIVLFDRLATLF
jgi:hypothetical protein